MQNKARSDWNQLGPKRLKISQRPIMDRPVFNDLSIPQNKSVSSYLAMLDKEPFLKWSTGSPSTAIVGKPLTTYWGLYTNVVRRMWDLAEFLSTYFSLYKDRPNLYGERMLAHVGNEVVRCYPWLDFMFTSVEAQRLLGKNIVTGLNNFEIGSKSIKETIKHLHREHYVPISYYRDIFHQQEFFTADDFFKSLVNNYRVVRITKAEQERLDNNGFKQQRPLDAYQKCGIAINETEIWAQIQRVII